MARLANYTFLCTLVFLAIAGVGSPDHSQIAIGAIAAVSVSAIAYKLGWLNREGAGAASVLGTVIFGLSGWPGALLLLLFFCSSSLISFSDASNRELTPLGSSAFAPRNGAQVWSNGFWFATFTVLSFLFTDTVWVAAAAGALATATADTWATELGSRRFDIQTYLITRFQKVPAGTDGGISFAGTLAALAGSAAISVATIYVFSLKPRMFFIILTAGFLGCLADSYFGAIFQRDPKDNGLSGLKTGSETVPGNNLVNWISTGIGSITAIIIKLL